MQVSEVTTVVPSTEAMTIHQGEPVLDEKPESWRRISMDQLAAADRVLQHRLARVADSVHVLPGNADDGD